MQDVGARLRQKRNSLGWSATKVATLAGISQAHLSRIENGTGGYAPHTLSKISTVLGISLGSLYGAQSNFEEAPSDFRLIPVLTYVQAARWLTRQLGDSENDMYPTVSTNVESSSGTFALELHGDSMTPRFSEGDIVIIDPSIPPLPGDFVVSRDEAGNASFTQYRDAGLNDTGQNVFELVPLNISYGPQRSDRQKLTIIGTMTEHRTYRKR